MSTDQILSVLGVSGIVSSIVGVLIAVFLKRPLEKRVQESERKAEAARKQQAQIEAQNTATMLGVQALLRDRLLQSFRYYHDKGWADYDERANIENMYVQYEALGPNSVMNKMHEKFVNLPDNPPAAIQ